MDRRANDGLGRHRFAAARIDRQHVADTLDFDVRLALRGRSRPDGLIGADARVLQALNGACHLRGTDFAQSERGV
jgi:hypothetical protein